MCRTPRGFTILEILIAMCIAAVGLTSVMYFFIVGARSHRRALNLTRAALLAEMVVDAQATSLYEGTPPQDVADGVNVYYSEFRYDVKWKQVGGPQSGAGCFYFIEVTIKWGDPKEELTRRNSEVYSSCLRAKQYMPTSPLPTPK